MHGPSFRFQALPIGRGGIGGGGDEGETGADDEEVLRLWWVGRMTPNLRDPPSKLIVREQAITKCED